MNGVADPDTGGLIRQSRDGDLAALGRLLATYRNYLTLLARLHIGQELQGKFAASDVVQETCLQAHRSIGQFRGSTEAELLQWLRSIHASKLANTNAPAISGRGGAICSWNAGWKATWTDHRLPGRHPGPIGQLPQPAGHLSRAVGDLGGRPGTTAR